MRKLAFIIFLSVGCLVASMQHSYAQTDPNVTTGEGATGEGDAQPAPVKEERKKGKTQADLDAENQAATQNQMPPEQVAYLKKMAKAKKEKEKRNAVTRKQADKRASQRLNKARSKTANKKKSYVKSHNKTKKKK